MAAQEASLVQQKPLDVVIIGGSIAGLIAGVLLKRRGHNVRILEQAESSQREGMAAGVGLSLHVRRFFDTEDRLEELIGMPNDDMLVMNRQLEVQYKIPVGMRMTTWDTAYYRLRANFDGLKSTYCLQPPAESLDGAEGEARFEVGKKVIGVEDVNGRMIVTAEDVVENTTVQYEGDIVIAADGGNSNIRRIFNPTLQREEPGYVIWRGVIPTRELSEDTLRKIEGKAIVWPGKYNYCVIYTIPGTNGSLSPGERHINFAWYFWPTSPSNFFEIMTDVFGHQHRTTVPKGQLRPEIWQGQLAQARRILPPELVELVEHIREPFVSVISSISAPRAAYFNNRLFLIGDALTQSQPNVGMGTNMAAMGAMSLVDVIGSAGKGPIDDVEVGKWEKKLLQESELIRVRSTAFASWFLNGWLRMGWFYARWWWVYYRQRWLGI